MSPVSGKGFKNGAHSQFFVTGTTDPGGVTVNSTAFVSSTQVVANINVDSAAVVSGFDVAVTNTDGASGKGSDIFSVVQGSNNSGNTCVIPALDPKFTLVATLNPNPAATGNLGAGVRLKKITLGGTIAPTPVLETVVGSVSTNTLEVYFLDPTAGTVLDGQVAVNGERQNHISIPLPVSAAVHEIAIGDVDGDGVPDIAFPVSGSPIGYVIRGQLDANGVLSYPGAPGSWYGLTPRASEFVPVSAGYQRGVALGKLGGSSTDIVVFGRQGGPTAPGTKGTYGGVFLFSWNGNGFSELAPIYDPDQNAGGRFGMGAIIGQITANGSEDLLVGAPFVGKLWVFPNGSTTSGYALSGVSGLNIGIYAGIGDVNGDGVNDLVSVTDWTGGSTLGGLAWTGLIVQGEAPAFEFLPDPNLPDGWGTHFDLGDVNGDGIADILVSTPNASPKGCATNLGVQYVFLSQKGSQPGYSFTRHILYPPANAGVTYGWSAGTIAGDPMNRIFVVGAKLGNQLYVYKVNQ